jgi:lipopolysaccharide export system protein LptA
MRRRASRRLGRILMLAGLVAASAGAVAQEKKDGFGLGIGALGDGKEPVTVTSDRLEFDYKKNVVVYSGSVNAEQGDLKIKSDELRITLKPRSEPEQKPEGDAPDGAEARAAENVDEESARVQEIVASGNVRIDQGGRWAVGGKAVFDQEARTFVLTDHPVLHEGPNEVAGDRVVVYLDEDRSVVEGDRTRVKAVLYPGSDEAKGKKKAKP